MAEPTRGPSQTELELSNRENQPDRQFVEVHASGHRPPLPPDLWGPSSSSATEQSDPQALGAPATFFCPISYQLFRDPVLLPTGQTYERRNISRWLKAGNLKCPVTGQYMSPPVALVPNVALRQSVEEWCAEHLPQLLDENGKLKAVGEDDEDPDDMQDMGKFAYYTDAPVHQSAWDEEAAFGHGLPGEASGQGRGNTFGRRRHNPDEDGQARGSSVFLHLMTAVFVCVFLGEIAANSWEFSPIQLNPLLGPGKDTLRKLGAKDTSLITDQDEWWRIFSSIFLSAGVIQLSGSLSAMWTFGRHLERELTSVTVAAVFLISAVGGALVSANLAPDAVTVSSTGGMFGLLGATSVEHMIDWRHYRHHAVTILNLVVVAAINLFIGLLPFVDNWCHVGGFVVGSLLCASILLNRRHGRNKFWEGCILVAQVGCALMALLVFTVFTIGLVMVLRIGADCRWCHFLTCVPSAWWTCDDVVTDPYPCSAKELSNSTVRLECPDGEKHWVRVLSSSKDNFRRLCQQQCSLSDMRDTGVIE